MGQTDPVGIRHCNSLTLSFCPKVIQHCCQTECVYGRTAIKADYTSYVIVSGQLCMAILWHVDYTHECKLSMNKFGIRNLGLSTSTHVCKTEPMI